MTQPIDALTALRVKREQKGLSARALSATVGKSSSYINKVESGEIQLSLAGFCEIANVLEMTNMELLYVLGRIR